MGNVADFEPQCRVPKKRHLAFKKPLQEVTAEHWSAIKIISKKSVLVYTRHVLRGTPFDPLGLLLNTV